MNNKIIGTASRTVANVFVLGIVAAASIFAIYTLKASGERLIGSLMNDVKSIQGKKGSDNIRKAA